MTSNLKILPKHALLMLKFAAVQLLKGFAANRSPETAFRIFQCDRLVLARLSADYLKTRNEIKLIELDDDTRAYLDGALFFDSFSTSVTVRIPALKAAHFDLAARLEEFLENECREEHFDLPQADRLLSLRILTSTTAISLKTSLQRTTTLRTSALPNTLITETAPLGLTYQSIYKRTRVDRPCRLREAQVRLLLRALRATAESRDAAQSNVIGVNLLNFPGYTEEFLEEARSLLRS